MKDYRISICKFVATVIVFFAGLVFLVNAYMHLMHTNEAILRMENTIASKTHQAQQQTVLAEKIGELGSDQQVLDSYFVTGDQATNFLQTIEGYGAQSGATMKFTGVEYDKTGNSISMALHITGTFQSVYKTLRLLENAPYQFIFSNIDFSRNPDSASKIPSWHANLMFTLTSFKLN